MYDTGKLKAGAPVQKTHIDNMRLVQSNRRMSAADGTSVVNVDRPSAAQGPVKKAVSNLLPVFFLQLNLLI